LTFHQREDCDEDDDEDDEKIILSLSPFYR